MSISKTPNIVESDWGELNGKTIKLFLLTNKNGNVIKITNYGGIVTSWISADKNGNYCSIVLGFDTFKEYLAPPPYFGAIIGRYANRIAKGKFILDGKEHSLAINNVPNALHGGIKGFDKVVWDVTSVDHEQRKLTLHYISKDGEEGYRGNVDVTVTYTFTDEDELIIEYNAETDKATPVNLTNHSYFNLTGSVRNTILNHTLMIEADKFTPVDDTLIPTGELKDVEGTPFDFRKPKAIGTEIEEVPGGYDHNFVLNKSDDKLPNVAVLYDEVSGRQLEVYTTQPGMQFYSGNFLDGSLNTSGGDPINKHTALCLETQHFPDSPNQPVFPSTILRPGEKFHSITKYKLVVV